jgi:hypothetical protein
LPKGRTLYGQKIQPRLDGGLGQNPGRTLKDQIIRVTGRLAHYGGFRAAWKERLQITLEDPSKLLLVAPAAEAKTKQP